MTELATNHADPGASRRTFVQLVAGGISLAAASRSYAGAPASDKIQVGFIGLGGQGTSRLNEFMKQPDVTAAAVCDLDQTHLASAVAAVEKAQGHKPAPYHDFRQLLERGHAGPLANIAYRTGERLYWDDAHERFTGGTRANQYVTRRYRKPWKLT